MTARVERTRTLEELLAERILIIGGPYGTYIHGRELSAEDYGGAHYDGCPEQLNVTRPDVIADAHRGYLEAGADIISTNTFGGGSIVLAEYGLQDRVRELNEAAARLAVGIAAQHATPGRPRFVAGNMGPTTKSLSLTGGISFEGMADVFHDWAAGQALATAGRCRRRRGAYPDPLLRRMRGRTARYSTPDPRTRRTR